MKIKTQLAVTMILFTTVLAITAVSMLFTQRRIGQLERQVEVARSLEQGAAELGYLSNDYLLYHEAPQRTRWETRLASYSVALSRLHPRKPEHQALVYSLGRSRQRLEVIFTEITSELESPPQALDAATEQALLKRSWNRLQIPIQGMVFDASRLAILLREQTARVNQTHFVLVFALIGAFLAYFLSNHLLVYRRVLRSIARLQEGTEIIGRGDLDFRIGVKANDEIGQLSDGFNRMASGLKEVTASKADLQREMAEKEQAQQALQDLNEELERRVVDRTALAESRTKQLQALAVELIEAEERERERISDLLHEDLQQILVSARLRLQAAQSGLPSVPVLGEVDTLLETSILKSRRLSQDLHPPVLHHMGLTAVLQWLARQMKERYGFEVELETSEGCNLQERALKTLLFRSVQELLFNAIKHAQVTSARVTLGDSAGRLTVTVSDRGRGFDPGILAPSAGGKLGRGLLGIRERIQALGGNLAVESTPGVGSSVRLTVPWAPVTADIAEGQTAFVFAPSQSGVQPLPTGGHTSYRVLFVDDHQVMRQGLISMLAGQPDIVVIGQASNGLEAVERARELRPDVIVMDVSMPLMDGVEATRRIKAEMPSVRVIGLSMHDEAGIDERMREAGAEAFVSKADSSGRLLEAIYGMRSRV